MKPLPQSEISDMRQKSQASLLSWGQIGQWFDSNMSCVFHLDAAVLDKPSHDAECYVVFCCCRQHKVLWNPNNEWRQEQDQNSKTGDGMQKDQNAKVETKSCEMNTGQLSTTEEERQTKHREEAHRWRVDYWGLFLLIDFIAPYSPLSATTNET